MPDQPSLTADNGYASLPKPLPPHLFYDLRAEQFIVLEYVVAAGWWRRVADYMTETAAIKAARTLSNTGTAAVVMRQVVTQGPMSFVMSALPEAENHDA